MRVLILLSCVAAIGIGMAQQQVQPPTRPTRSQDGGTREVLESIVIPPLANAPFSGSLATQWARPMADGGTYTLANKRRIVRDSAGRIYEERWMLVPKESDVKSSMNFIQIADPNNHTLYACNTFKKICALTEYRPPQSATFEGDETPPHSFQTEDASQTVEDLGMKNLLGVDTVGTRQTTTIKSGVVGNDRPFQIVLEFWHSPRLGFNLQSIRSDPRIGTQTFTITELETAGPIRSFFPFPKATRWWINKRTHQSLGRRWPTFS